MPEDAPDKPNTTETKKQEKKNQFSNDVWLTVLFYLLVVVVLLQFGYIFKKDMTTNTHGSNPNKILPLPTNLK